MEITVNNQPLTLPETVAVDQLLSAVLHISTSGIAVAVNQSVISKSDWSAHMLQAGDRVVLIKATQGG